MQSNLSCFMDRVATRSPMSEIANVNTEFLAAAITFTTYQEGIQAFGSKIQQLCPIEEHDNAGLP